MRALQTSALLARPACPHALPPCRPPTHPPTQAADLVEELAEPEVPLTVFAPTNDAFATALAALNLTAEELLGNTELLTDVSSIRIVWP